ncbi:MAG: hypothetical protein M5U28_21450 [Sandaracinaceae bacterium]|nr:hypothetical protein [Sandaracinaceae bacterium]
MSSVGLCTLAACVQLSASRRRRSTQRCATWLAVVIWRASMFPRVAAWCIAMIATEPAVRTPTAIMISMSV